jgi:hypothetical protein
MHFVVIHWEVPDLLAGLDVQHQRYAVLAQVQLQQPPQQIGRDVVRIFAPRPSPNRSPQLWARFSVWQAVNMPFWSPTSRVSRTWPGISEAGFPFRNDAATCVRVGSGSIIDAAAQAWQ